MCCYYLLLPLLCLVLHLSNVNSSALNSVTVQVKQTKNNHNAKFDLQFTNQVYERVCNVHFQLDLPNTAKLSNYSMMVPIPDTRGQYALPNSLDLLPGETFDAQLTLVGTGKPVVIVLGAKTIPTSEKCRNSN